MEKLKVLNLYAGIGGNRKLWTNVDVTAIEINPTIAKIYQDLFPDDKVVVGDAHKYLLEHYQEFDFIWSSPPCPTHSRFRKITNGGRFKDVYPDMSLWQEIIFIKHHFKGKWVIENVFTYYEPLIIPQICARHYFWSNFKIPNLEISKGKVENKKGNTLNKKMQSLGIMITNFHNYQKDKRTLLNNAIEPELGKHIFDCAFRTKQKLLSEVSGNSSHT